MTFSFTEHKMRFQPEFIQLFSIQWNWMGMDAVELKKRHYKYYKKNIYIMKVVQITFTSPTIVFCKDNPKLR